MKNILFEIRDKLPSMTAVEQRVAKYVLEHSAEVIEMSAQTLAKASQTSPSAIVRFSRKMKLEGFPQLKLLLSANLGQNDVQPLVEELSENDSVPIIKQKVKMRLNYMVDQTNLLLSDEAVEKATYLLHQAETIFVYGVGASSLVAQDIYQKFMRIGKRVVYSQDLHLLLTSMVTIGDKGVLIAISNSGENHDLIRLVNHSVVTKMSVIAMTRNPTSTLGKKSDIVLQSSPGENIPLRAAATISLMAQLYVVDILFYAFAVMHYQETGEKIQATREAVSQLEK